MTSRSRGRRGDRSSSSLDGLGLLDLDGEGTVDGAQACGGATEQGGLGEAAVSGSRDGAERQDESLDEAEAIGIDSLEDHVRPLQRWPRMASVATMNAPMELSIVIGTA